MSWEVGILCHIHGMLIRELREEVPVCELGSRDPLSYHIWGVNQGSLVSELGSWDPLSYHIWGVNQGSVGSFS